MSERGGGKAQQLRQALLVGEVLAQAFLQHRAEFGVELGVLADGGLVFLAHHVRDRCLAFSRGSGLRQLVVLGQVFQHGEHALGAAVADRLHVAAFLQQLAADVERQIIGVDHALDEAQVGGQQCLGVVHDEDALDVELDAGLLVAIPQVHRRLGRDVEQLGVFGAAFDAVVRPGQRGLEVVADGFVELGVLLVADVFLGARPQGRSLVDGFPLAGLDHAAGLAAAGLVPRGDQLAVFPLFLFHHDGQADVVGVLVDDVLELPAAGVVHRVVAQVQDDAGAALGAGNGFDLEVAGAAAGPAHAFGLLHAGAAGLDGDLVGHDEAGVKAHAELADELGVGLLVAAELAHEVLGAALGDGAEVVDGFLGAHADAVVGDGQRFRVLVKGELHLEFGVALVQAAVVDGLEAQLVAGVRRVGDQLAQENFLVRVQRMGHQVQQLGDFGLEGKGLLGHGLQNWGSEKTNAPLSRGVATGFKR